MKSSRLAFRRRGLAVAAAATVAFAVTLSSSAQAQVNYDVGASVGAMKRFTTGAECTGCDPGFGGVTTVTAHVALFPMVRLGIYASADLSPMPNAGTREFYEGGLHLKFTPPLLSAPWKFYATLGFGVAYAHADSYSGAVTQSSPLVYGTYSSIDGQLLEVPIAIGLADKISRRWEMFVELGGRFGVAFLNAIYDNGDTGGALLQNCNAVAAANSTSGVSCPAYNNFTGIDSFALSLSLGVNWTD
jgi:hypothetical protein